MKNKRFIITIPEALREALQEKADYHKCSKAEVVRDSLYIYLRDFIGKERKKERQMTLIEAFQKMVEGKLEDG